MKLALVVWALMLFFNFRSNASETPPLGWEESRTIAMEVYMFNWTNPEDINNPNIKPHFEEVGPYKFRQVKEKANVVWNDNGTVTYQYLRRFYFDEENSGGKESDVITTINIVALAAAQIANSWNFFLKQAVKMGLLTTGAKIYVRKTVGELLFEGYNDPLITSMNVLSIQNQIDRVGWFYKQNGSVYQEGIFNVDTNPNEFGTIKTWNYRNSTPFFRDNCAEIKGSAGEFFPVQQKPPQIAVFSPLICRTAMFNFQGEVPANGRTGYKYSPGDEVFDNGTLFKENQCYCSKGGCAVPSGVLDISECTDAPVYLSLPHFYYADPSYVQAIEGLNPEKDKHEFYFTLDPSIGVVVDSAVRMQINVPLKSLSSFPLYKNVQEFMFPVLWMEEKILLSEDVDLNSKFVEDNEI